MNERTPERSAREQDAGHQYPPRDEQGQEEILKQRQQQYDTLRELLDSPPPGATVKYVDVDGKLRPHQRRKETYYEVDSTQEGARPSELTNDGKVLVHLTQLPSEPSVFMNVNQGILVTFSQHPENPLGLKRYDRSSVLLPDGSFPRDMVENMDIEKTLERISYFSNAIQEGRVKPFNKPPTGK